MKLVQEDLWQPADIHVITTNGMIASKGLVMGAGVAKEAAERMPGIEARCAEVILELVGIDTNPYIYGFQMVSDDFGIFQVKRDWRDPAELKLIELSSFMLGMFARDHPRTEWVDPDHPELGYAQSDGLLGKSIRMNFPGIGLGKLTREEVEPILTERLPDNVTVCYL